jgi:HD-GYP domain-containing protein (c-di-GMP phosphodiesterase class II)
MSTWTTSRLFGTNRPYSTGRAGAECPTAIVLVTGRVVLDDGDVRDSPVRLAELVGGLCVVSDLGKGLSDGQGWRTCAIAMELADVVGLRADERETVFWIGLLRFVGCTATASEMAAALGDELAVSAAFASADPREISDVLRGAIAAVGGRPDRLLTFLMRAPAVVREHEVASCEVAEAMTRALGLPETVAVSVGQVFERWDGKGHPGRRGGLELSRAVRTWQVAHLVELMTDTTQIAGDARRLAAELRQRAGTALDPQIASAAAEVIDRLLRVQAATGGLADLLAGEPPPHRMVEPERIPDVLGEFGLLADLKSPHFRGHSASVADLAVAAGERIGLAAPDLRRLRCAALVHDVGRVGVSSRIWNCPTPLSDTEREQIELHPYYTQRVLARVPALRDLAELAAAHHERCDGTGYHRGLHGAGAQGPLVWLLAASDRYVTAGESRPYRPPRSETERAALLQADRDAGRLPADAVDAVLAVAGHNRTAPPLPRIGLTDREREVLAVIARGLTNVAAARLMQISPKTVNAHLEHIYAKLGVSTRAAAIVDATRRGWIDLS